MPDPGYYPDPATGGSVERWWDGSSWLHETKPSGGPLAPVDMPPPGADLPSQRTGVTVTGTDQIDGTTVAAYLGVVTGRAITGTGILRDIGAGLRDTVGGRSKQYEAVLVEAEQDALTQLHATAAARGANAVLATRLAYESVRDSMLMVVAQGTAVVVGELEVERTGSDGGS